MRAIRFAPRHSSASMINKYHARGGSPDDLTWILFFWFRESSAIRDKTSGHLLFRQRLLRPAVPGVLGLCLPPGTFICPHLSPRTPGNDPAPYFLGSYRVLSDAVEKLSATEQLQDTESGFVYKAVRCTQCVSKLVITLKPAKVSNIPANDKDLRSCQWIIEVAQYVDFGIMKALDEPEWQALVGKAMHRRASGDSIMKRFGDCVEGREQLAAGENTHFVDQRDRWESWVVEGSQVI